MIKFTAMQDERLLIGFGLSRGNIDRLTAGQPIKIDLKEMNVGIDGDIIIFFGETETEMQTEIQPLITSKTKLFIDPKLKH